MRSPAAALGWEFFHRHRGYVAALIGYLLLLGLIKPLYLGADVTVRFDPPDGFAAFAVVPFTVTFFYLIGVFTFGLTGDLAARQSIYPSRMFTLPLRTAALAGWPMLYGCAAMLALWMAATLLARWPWGVELPWLWPGLLASVVLGWIQVFTWMPYGLRGARVIAAVVILFLLDAVVFTAIELQWPETALVAFLAPQLPLAYACACVVLTRARRGDVPDWSLFRAGAGSWQTLRPFPSISRAQLWFEWRRHGATLPALVGLVLPFELSVLFISGYGSQAFVAKVFAAVMLTPILMAAFAAATVSKANPFAREVYGVTPFAATKPMTTAQFIAAKLRMAAISTVAAWLIVGTFTAIGFMWSGGDSVLVEWADRFVRRVGAVRAVVLALLVLTGLVSVTWTMLVQGLFIGLTGRQWIVRTIGLITLVAVMMIGPAIEWILDLPDADRWIWDGILFVPATLVAVKMGIAVWVAARLVRSRLVSERVLVIGAAAWAAAVLALHIVLVWWVDMSYIPPHLLAFIAVLAVPLVRISAAPLALAWNRHR